MNQVFNAPTVVKENHDLFSITGKGIYISGLIAHTKKSILLDTGATTSIIDENTWKKCGSYTPHNLKQINAKLTVANGQPLQILGKIEVRLRVGTFNELIPMVVVRGISHDAILGSDFFQANRCNICYDTGTLSIAGECEIPIHYQESQPSVCRVVLEEEVQIEPGMEVSVFVQLEKGYDKNNGSPGVVEQPGSNCLHSVPSLGKTLVVPREGRAMVKMANFTDNTVKIKSRKVIGKFYPLHQNTASVSAFDLESCQNDENSKYVDKVNHENETELSSEQRCQFSAFLEEFDDVMAKEDGELGLTDLIEHKIETGNAVPIKQSPRRLPPHKKEIVEKQLDDLLKQGRIEESNGPWSSPVVLARKKDGSYRLCIDYRKLNEVTTRDAQPLPRIDDILESLDGAVWFSTLDLASGYWQVPVSPQDRDKTAFVTHKGQFRWTCMPFGLTNGPATFQRLMNLALKGIAWKDCLVYLDDIIIWSSTFDEHLRQLRAVFERLRAAKVKLKKKKCSFLQRSIKFLGHVVSAKGIQTDPDKTKAVQEWPTPKDVAELRSFLGLCSYYRRFINNFAVITEPLRRLLQKGTEFAWKEQQERAFQELKNCLVTPPVLAYPNFGPSAGEFVLDTDASTEKGIGAVLSQLQEDGTEKVIAYGSRSLQPNEKNYCATRLEMLALVAFIHEFRYYLLGKKFTVRTDHHALKWLRSFKEPEGQVARWLERLQEYEFEVVHRAGKEHVNADVLSRKPRRKHPGRDNCPSCSSIIEDKFVAALHQDERLSSQEQLADECLWSPIELRNAQLKDVDLSYVIQLIQDDVTPSKQDLQSKSPLVKSILSSRELLELDDHGVLKINPTKQIQTWSSRIVLPEELIAPALQRLHDGVEGGHLGILKTLRKMQQRFWRPGLAKAVTNYCKSCLVCAECKAGKSSKAPLTNMTTGSPMQRVHIDVIGPLPRSKKGNKYILTVQCAFTKWSEAYAIRNQTAATCASKLVTEWIHRYGVPDNIHSDQGRNFESSVFKEMCNVLDIKKTRTTAYHPAGNGQVENFNKTLKGLLKAKVQEEVNTWDDHIGACMMAYRSSIHQSTGYTPFYLMFGREMRLPIDVMIGSPEGTDEQQLYGQFATKLQHNLTSSYQCARENLKKAQQRQKEYYDKGTKKSLYQAGDKVYLHNPHIKQGEASKFHRNWKGPFTIAERITDVNYKLKGPKGKIVHSNNLKLYKGKEQIQREKKERQQKKKAAEKGDESYSDQQYSNSADDQVKDSSDSDESESLEEETSDSSDDSSDNSSECNEASECSDDSSGISSEHRGRTRQRKEPVRYGDWAFNSVETYFSRL